MAKLWPTGTTQGPTHRPALAATFFDVVRHPDIAPASGVLLARSTLKARFLAPRSLGDHSLVEERGLAVVALKVLPPPWRPGLVQHPGRVAYV